MSAQEVISEAARELKTSVVATFQRGDHVLICLSDPMTSHEHAQHMMRTLTNRFPGVEFTFLAGVSCLAVQHAENGKG